jgi:hypothetical protein
MNYIPEQKWLPVSFPSAIRTSITVSTPKPIGRFKSFLSLFAYTSGEI